MYDPYRNRAELIQLISDLTGSAPAAVSDRLDRELKSAGANVRQAFAAFGGQRYVFDETMARFYGTSDAFLYELAVWNQNKLKRRMSKWVCDWLLERWGCCRVLCYGDGIGCDSARMAVWKHAPTYFEVPGLSAEFARRVFHRRGLLVWPEDGSAHRQRSSAGDFSGLASESGDADFRGRGPGFRGQNFRGLNFRGLGATGAEGVTGDAGAGKIGFVTDSELLPRGVYDAVTCLDVLEHVPDPEALVRQLVSHLRPGGVLFVHAPFYMIHPNYPTHVAANRRFSGDLTLFTAAGLRPIDGRGFWNPLVFQAPGKTPGSYATGNSAPGSPAPDRSSPEASGREPLQAAPGLGRAMAGRGYMRLGRWATWPFWGVNWIKPWHQTGFT